jgi:hypothetical protein
MRTWNLRLNLDELNALAVSSFTDQERIDAFHGLVLGCNAGTLPEQCSNGVRRSFEIGLSWRHEAEGFKDRKAKAGKVSAETRKAKFGTAQPPNSVRTDPERCPNQTTNHKPQTSNPENNKPTDPQPKASAACLEVISIWNESTQGKLPKAKLIPKRETEIKARLKEPGWLDDFRASCSYLITQPWATGQGDKPWTATIDYLLRKGKATENAEKSNAPKNGAPNGSRSPQHRAAIDAAYIDHLSARTPAEDGEGNKDVLDLWENAAKG